MWEIDSLFDGGVKSHCSAVCGCVCASSLLTTIPVREHTHTHTKHCYYLSMFYTRTIIIINESNFIIFSAVSCNLVCVCNIQDGTTQHTMFDCYTAFGWLGSIASSCRRAAEMRSRLCASWRNAWPQVACEQRARHILYDIVFVHSLTACIAYTINSAMR